MCITYLHYFVNCTIVAMIVIDRIIDIFPTFFFNGKKISKVSVMIYIVIFIMCVCSIIIIFFVEVRRLLSV